MRRARAAMPRQRHRAQSTTVRSCSRAEPPPRRPLGQRRHHFAPEPARRFGEKQRAEQPAAARIDLVTRPQMPVRSWRRHQHQRRRPRRRASPRSAAPPGRRTRRRTIAARSIRSRSSAACDLVGEARPSRRRRRPVPTRSSPSEKVITRSQRAPARPRARASTPSAPECPGPAPAAPRASFDDRRARSRSDPIVNRQIAQFSVRAAFRSSACAESARASCARRRA